MDKLFGFYTFTKTNKPTAMYGAKIKAIRELRGFSQENVAAKIGITQAAYSRIENNQSKLDTAVLEKIAAELGVSPIDIMSAEPIIMNFYGANHGAQGNFQHIEQQILTQKELYEKIIASKDEEIMRLQKTIDALIAKQ